MEYLSDLSEFNQEHLIRCFKPDCQAQETIVLILEM